MTDHTEGLPACISTEFLSNIAGNGGRYAIGKISPLGAGLGYSGQLFLVEPDGAADQPLDPVIVKCPSPDPNIRQMMNAQGFYNREAAFYRSWAEQTGLETPDLLGVEKEEDGTPVLVLSYISDAEPGDQDRGIAPDEAHAIVREIARCHTTLSTEQNTKAIEASGIPSITAGPDIAAFYSGAWPKFADIFSGQMPKWLTQFGPSAGPEIAAARAKLAEPPVTLLHGDLRLDNLLFHADGRIVFLDWQAAVLGRPGFDLGYLAAGNFTSHTPGEISAYLAAYHQAITELGWTDYGLDQIREDYETAILFLLARTVISGAYLPFSEGPAFEKFSRALLRWCDAAENIGIA